MDLVYNTNGLVFWSQEEIEYRNWAKTRLIAAMQRALTNLNSAWDFTEIEGPLLTPRELINQNYTNEDVWVQEGGDLVLRPETTPTSYAYARYLFEHQISKAPTCVFQSGKSFRREQDQVTKNMRLKEFYQLEFQCIYAADSMCDYHSEILEPVRNCIASLVPFETRIVESDRLPSYSEITMDVEVNNGDKWMEVCSISRRTDFPEKLRFQTKKGVVEKNPLVLEVAIGLDRVVYNFMQWSKQDSSA